MGRRTGVLAVVVTALAVLAGCGGRDAGSSAGATASPGTVELTASPLPAGARCAVPDAKTLAEQEVAFEGDVTALEDGRATLAVTRWFSPAREDTVVVVSPSEELQELLLAVRFEVGRTYLVSATDGAVSLCGFSAEATADLEAIYEQAFAAAG